MDSYQETETYEGKYCTNLKSIDPLRYHDRIDGLELGYMSSRVAEKKYLWINKNITLRSVVGAYPGYPDHQLACSYILWLCFKIVVGRDGE